MPHESDTHASVVLDVRGELLFQQGHTSGAASVPFEDIASRMYELPPREVTITVEDAALERAEAAAALLRERGFTASARVLDPATAVETGPSRARLWRPNPF